jgi:hypothetical protein
MEGKGSSYQLSFFLSFFFWNGMFSGTHMLTSNHQVDTYEALDFWEVCKQANHQLYILTHSSYM